MSADGLEKIITRAVSEGINFPWLTYILVLFSAFLGSFFASYLKKKGENVATKEDYESLLQQIKNTTVVTESIKTELASGSWVNQQSWLLKEKYYSQLLNEFYKLRLSLSSRLDYYIEPGSQYNDENKNNNKNYIYQNKIGSEALKKIKNIQGSSEIVISIKTKDALENFHKEYWSINYESMCNKDYLDPTYKLTDKTYIIILKEAKLDLNQ